MRREDLSRGETFEVYEIGNNTGQYIAFPYIEKRKNLVRDERIVSLRSVGVYVDLTPKEKDSITNILYSYRGDEEGLKSKIEELLLGRAH